MRVLIIDDEPLAQTALVRILNDRPDIEAFECAGDAVEALEKLKQKSYDVLLLDIRMPEISGIELADRLREKGPPLPSLIFVTAFEKHAVEAFEKQAVDYVLKPFSAERIHEALNRAARRAASERASQLLESLPLFRRNATQQPDRIAIKAKGRILLIDPREVASVHAEGNYVLLQKQSGSYLLRESISEMETKLQSYGFIRIHRSVLVNGAYVEEIRALLSGEYGLRIRGNKQFTVTRTYKKNLKALAAFWVGTESVLAE
jgi:two-component system, LytTR family, response regulator